MANTLNSGSIKELKPGQTLLVQARKVKNGKVQLEWAEKINNSNNATRRTWSAVQLLNSSDPAFSSGARRAFFSSVVEDVSKYLGINLGDDNEAWYISTARNGNEVEVMDLDILNPHVEIDNVT